MSSSLASLDYRQEVNYALPQTSLSEQAVSAGSGTRGTANMQELLLEHLPQVRLVARSLWGRTRFHVDLDDLVGYGMLGLLDAVRKFDPSRGFLLRTYAEHRIRGAILDGLRTMDCLSRSARREAKTRNGDAQQTKLSVEAGTKKTSRIRMENGGGGQRISPSATGFAEEEPGRFEWSYSRSCHAADLQSYEPNQERIVEQKQQQTALAQAIENLSERQKNVLEFYYQRELSMRQIAVLLGVHESRVSQIHLAALARLRKSLCSKPAQPTRIGVIQANRAARLPPTVMVV